MQEIKVYDQNISEIEWIRKHKEYQTQEQVIEFLIKFYYNKIGKIRNPVIVQMLKNIREGLD